MAVRQKKFYGYSAEWLKLLQTRSAFLIGVTLVATIVNGQHFTTIKSDEGIEILENHKKVLFYQVRQNQLMVNTKGPALFIPFIASMKKV